jgi:hypothetical protein
MSVSHHVMTTLPVMSLGDLVDLDDDGALGWPDLLGWAFFGTVGLLGAVVCLGLLVGALVSVARAVRWAARRAWRQVRSPLRWHPEKVTSWTAR